MINIPIPNTWSTGFSEVTYVARVNTLVILGYHTQDTSKSSDPASGWFQMVAIKNPDGSFKFSTANPQPTGITKATSPAGHLSVRADSIIEFVWLDASGNPNISRNNDMKSDNTGTWY